MAYEFYDATIANIIDENDVVKRFFIKVPDERPFSFKAGQFIMVDLPIDSKYTNRSYSIASAPSADNMFELCIVLNPKGMGTPYMWENYKVGTTVKLSRVLGKFTLPEVIDRDICFICTGTGIAPLRAMLHDIYNKGAEHKNIYMVFGNRWTKDVIYRKEMEDMQAKHPEFSFIPVLSRDNADWNGRKGYVHAIYEEIFADKRPAYFFICGWADMLKEARQRLEAMGYDKKSIKFESYD
ncbi:MAG TPA: ferredoxin--NADP reductase [Bacteroidia bacterium]|nr:ferredoxin--NADP reductase [Bacteroidia bacterium]HNU32205.1 ferredoxin--NADP reductase [Bacteroidia bacterium]